MGNIKLHKEIEDVVKSKPVIYRSELDRKTADGFAKRIYYDREGNDITADIERYDDFKKIAHFAELAAKYGFSVTKSKKKEKQ